MKKIVTSTLIASIVLLFASCSSDDSSTTPPPPPTATSTYSISKVHQINFFDPTEAKTEEPLIRSANIFDFNYKEDASLSFITYTIDYYKDNKIENSASYKMEHNLNQEGRLIYYGISDDTGLYLKHLYTYDRDLLASEHYTMLKQNFSYESKFTYNTKNQLIKRESQDVILLGEFSYDNANKINNIKRNGENHKVTHDNKQNPFGPLPYDLTMEILKDNNILPFSYHFANNITTYGNRTVEYTYNEGDLPTKASMYYKPEDGPKYLASEITYSYTIKETKQ